MAVFAQAPPVFCGQKTECERCEDVVVLPEVCRHSVAAGLLSYIDYLRPLCDGTVAKRNSAIWYAALLCAVVKLQLARLGTEIV
eukprot:2175746-Amphidinium_carterae.1